MPHTARPSLPVPLGGSRPPVRHTILRAVELAMGALFLYLGSTKLMGTTESVRLFDVAGVGSWLRYATGTLELIGAGLLFSPTLARVASFPRAVITAAVAIIEIFILKRPPAAAAVCVTAHGFITWGRRQNARRTLADASHVLAESLPPVEQSR